MIGFKLKLTALAIEKINALKKFGYKDIQLSAEATDDDLPVYRIFVHNFDNIEAAENYVSYQYGFLKMYLYKFEILLLHREISREKLKEKTSNLLVDP